MRMMLLSFTVLVCSATARAQEAPRAVIQRALKAHGGEERLSRHRADRVKLKGKLVFGTKEVSFTGETTVQLPAQLRNLLRLEVDGRTITLVQILNGDMVHVAIDSQPQKVEAPALAEMRDKLRLARAVRLVALLDDPAYTLQLLPESTVQNRPAIAVRVVNKGQRDLRLFFDRENGLLVKTEVPLVDASGKEVAKEEHIYGDFRDLSGFRRPVKMTTYRNGIKIMDAELTEVQYYERLDDAEFAKP